MTDLTPRRQDWRRKPTERRRARRWATACERSPAIAEHLTAATADALAIAAAREQQTVSFLDGVAKVTLRRLIEDGLAEGNGEFATLTRRGVLMGERVMELTR